MGRPEGAVRAAGAEAEAERWHKEATDKQKAAERANEVSQDRLRRAEELDPDAGDRSDTNGEGRRRDRDDDGTRRERDDDQGSEEGRRGPRS